MAAKVKMLKLLQEMRGFAAITRRLPPPRSPGLLLMQVRALGINNSLRKRKLSITIGTQSSVDIPHPVRIHHVKQSSDAVGTAPPP